MDLEDLTVDLEEVKSASADFGGQLVEFTYRPAMIKTKTLAFMDRVEGENDSVPFVMACRGMILDTFVDWNLHYRGEPVPITPEAIDQLPGAFVAGVVAAMKEDAAPNPPPASLSDAGQSRPARQTRRRTGTSSSSRRAT